MKTPFWVESGGVGETVPGSARGMGSTAPVERSTDCKYMRVLSRAADRLVVMASRRWAVALGATAPRAAKSARQSATLVHAQRLFDMIDTPLGRGSRSDHPLEEVVERRVSISSAKTPARMAPPITTYSSWLGTPRMLTRFLQYH